MIDVLDYMKPSINWMANYRLVDSTGKLNLSVVTKTNQIWYLKGTGGFPWDMNTYDDDYVYQSLTDSPSSWTSPVFFQMFASPSNPNANGGIIWSPRLIQENLANPPVDTLDSTFRIYSAQNKYVTQNLGGPVRTQISGPTIQNLGGDLGYQDTLILSYLWGSGFANQEVNTYVRNIGWVQWQKNILVNNIYQAQQKVIYNKVINSKGPQVNFPSGVPVI